MAFKNAIRQAIAYAESGAIYDIAAATQRFTERKKEEQARRKEEQEQKKALNEEN